MKFTARMDSLKVSTSTLALDVVQRAMGICGLKGYRNDSEYTLGAKHLDVIAAPLMVNNDRSLQGNAQHAGRAQGTLMVPRIAVLHHPRSFFALELCEMVDGAADILWVLCGQDRVGAMDPRLLSRLGTVVDVAGMTPDEAAEVLAAHRPDGIVSFVDDHIEDAAALAERLGLRYHTPEVACSVVDKRIQRTALAGAGVAGPEFRVIPPGASRGWSPTSGPNSVIPSS